MQTPATAPDPLAPAQLGPISLRNRVIKSATFEGATPDAFVTERLIEYHRAVGEGGVGMTTVAYLAVAPEGRTDYGQVWWREEAHAGLRQLTDAIHKTGAKASAQIGHAGPVANSQSTKLPSLAPSKRLNALSMSFDNATTQDDIDRIIRQHGEAAKQARDVGFDAVEIHLGHTYLAGSFLSPAVNKRKDKWGGSLQNRAEFPRRIVESVKQAIGDDVAVLAKMNMRDGAKGALELEESIPFAKMLEADGHLDALELTAGSSLLNPMYLFHGDVPLKEFAAAQPPLLKVGIYLAAPFMFKKYPYKPLYFADMARQFRQELTMPLVLLGGVEDYEGMTTAMNDGFDFIAMGRALLREPNLINEINANHAKKSLCIHCNQCMASIYTGTHCYLDVEGSARLDAASREPIR